jgi:ATP-dependent Clp protease protease subunit
MAVNHEFYEAYLASGFDVRNRRVFLYGDINEANIGMLVKSLYILESNNAEKPIEVIISSCGGDEYEMFAAYDAIMNCKCHVVTVAIGKVMSAAPLILAAGDHRLAFPNTSFMVHESWYGLEDKHTNVKANVHHYEELEKIWCRLMEKHTKISAKEWRLKYNSKPDQFFNVTEALKIGLIDGIVGE